MNNWSDKLPRQKRKKESSAYMVRPSKRVNDWLLEQSNKHPGVSINKIIIAIIESVMEKDIEG